MIYYRSESTYLGFCIVESWYTRVVPNLNREILKGFICISLKTSLSYKIENHAIYYVIYNLLVYLQCK